MSDGALPLHGWTVVSLRPRGQHASVRCAAAPLGARTLGLSPFAIAPRDDPAGREALAAATACPIVLVTSPNAVRAAHALQPLRARAGQQWLAVGAGSRDALARVGVAAASPRRMDSEGLLAMPALQAVDGVDVGFVTAPGGRGKIAATLQARGAIVHRADVYLRQPVAIRAAAWHRLQAALADPARVLLLASSEEALRAMLAQAPSGLQPGLRNVAVAVPGERLANVARAAGFGRVVDTGSPRPAAMLREAAAIA